MWLDLRVKENTGQTWQGRCQSEKAKGNLMKCTSHKGCSAFSPSVSLLTCIHMLQSANMNFRAAQSLFGHFWNYNSLFFLDLALCIHTGHKSSSAVQSHPDWLNVHARQKSPHSAVMIFPDSAAELSCWRLGRAAYVRKAGGRSKVHMLVVPPV